MNKLEPEIERMLITEALKSTMHKQYAAMIMSGGKVIAIGCNYFFELGIYTKRKRRMENIENKKFSIHAEENVIKQAKRKNGGVVPKGSILYVIRIVDNRYYRSTPCPKCEKLIIENSISKIYYME